LLLVLGVTFITIHRLHRRYAKLRSSHMPSFETKQGIEPSFSTLKPIPPEYQPAIECFQKQVTTENRGEFYGLSDEASVYRVFHGTTDTKLRSIAKEGLKAFFEMKAHTPSIFVTASPTLALWHAAENGPHDTLRKNKSMSDDKNLGKPILLLVTLDKAWVRAQPDAMRPLDLSPYRKERHGIVGDKDNRLWSFRESLREEVSLLDQGEETDDFGFRSPIDLIPPEHISVLLPDGTVQPIQDYVAQT
jgi:hypothetical protein